MYFHFLVEDASTEALIHQLMKLILPTDNDHTYSCKSYHGLGGFRKNGDIKEQKTGKLLNELLIALPGISKALQKIPAVIVVVLDSDQRNPTEFQDRIEQTLKEKEILTDYVICLAVQEIESWLLGDKQAISVAYPQARLSLLDNYQADGPDANCMTLANIVYKGGWKKLQKSCSAYAEIGKQKELWANTIGKHMNIEGNTSPSFNRFIEEINKRISA